MKRILAVLAAAFLLLLCALPAAADGETRVEMGNGVSYDREQQCYTYPVSGGQEITSSICTGMVTNGTVWVKAPVGIELKLYRNGSPVEDPDFENITQPGEYHLAYRNNKGMNVNVMDFTIQSRYFSGSKDFVPPAGFWITGLVMNGEPAYYQNTYADLSKEGRYEMTLTGVNNGVDSKLLLWVDRTPPTLALSEVSNGKALSAVDISDRDPKDEIYITLGGRPIEYTPLLTRAGNYEITIRDYAGNESNYQFEIVVRYSFNYLTILLAAVAVAAVAVALLLYGRNSRRIR